MEECWGYDRLHIHTSIMKIEDFISEFGEKKTHQFLVSEDVYLTFQKCSGDINLLHIDDNYAIEKGFIQKVMYGNILNSFISYFVGFSNRNPFVKKRTKVL